VTGGGHVTTVLQTAMTL